MDEGTRPVRLRGTPAGTQRHRACAAVLFVCISYGFFLEYNRKRGGYYDRMVSAKQELSPQQQLKINSMFTTPLYTQDGVARVHKKIAAEAEDVLDDSFVNK